MEARYDEVVRSPVRLLFFCDCGRNETMATHPDSRIISHKLGVRSVYAGSTPVNHTVRLRTKHVEVIVDARQDEGSSPSASTRRTLGQMVMWVRLPQCLVDGLLTTVRWCFFGGGDRY